MTNFWKVIIIGAVFAMASIACQQGPKNAPTYPVKDVRLIVPWGAGGGTDGIVRKITSIAEEEFGGSIYVENIEGGLSATGVSQLMNARGDGYTIGALTYDSIITVPWQGLVPRYDLGRLKFIARVTAEPDALIASTGSEFGTLEDVLRAAKRDPGQIKIGIQNIGSRLHLALLQLQDERGVKFKVIAYPAGAAAQKEAMLNGEVKLVMTSLGDFSSMIEDGQARGLVEFSDAPNPTYPDVPTAADEALALRMGSFLIFAAPADTPEEIIQQLEAAFQIAYDSEAFQSWLVDVGVTPAWLGAADVTPWADETTKSINAQLETLVKDGVLSK